MTLQWGEIQELRPCVVVSHGLIGTLPVRIVVRCVSEDRFVKQLGVLSTDDMSDISAALAIALDISS